MNENLNCSKVKRLLDDPAFDATGIARQQDLQEHLLVCTECRMEWEVQQKMFSAWANEQAPELSESFTAQVMAQLPPVPAKRFRVSFDNLLVFLLTVGGLVVVGFSLKSVIAKNNLIEKLSPTLSQKLQALSITFKSLATSIQQFVVNAFGEQIIEQGWQVVLISLVTFFVIKGALLVESRLKRMF